MKWPRGSKKKSMSGNVSVVKDTRSNLTKLLDATDQAIQCTYLQDTGRIDWEKEMIKK